MQSQLLIDNDLLPLQFTKEEIEGCALVLQKTFKSSTNQELTEAENALAVHAKNPYKFIQLLVNLIVVPNQSKY